MLEIIKGRPAVDYGFKLNPTFKAEAFNPVFRAEAGNYVIDEDVSHSYLCPILPVRMPRAIAFDDEGKRIPGQVVISDKAYEQILKLIDEPAAPSQKLIDLMNRKPRYEKKY